MTSRRIAIRCMEYWHKMQETTWTCSTTKYAKYTNYANYEHKVICHPRDSQVGCSVSASCDIVLASITWNKSCTAGETRQNLLQQPMIFQAIELRLQILIFEASQQTSSKTLVSAASLQGFCERTAASITWLHAKLQSGARNTGRSVKENAG